MAKMKFPEELKLSVDLKKIHWPRVEAWITERVTQLLKGVEDEVLIGIIVNKLQDQTEVCYTTHSIVHICLRHE